MRVITATVGAVKRVFDGIARKFRTGWCHCILGALGSGAIIDRGVIFYSPGNIFIGNRVAINQGALLQGSPGGKITIGDGCVISYRAMVLTAGLKVPFTESERQHQYGDIVIGKNVWLCAGVIVLPGTVIEDNVVVAAGAVVRGHLNDGWYYGGVPAKPISPIPGKADGACTRRESDRNG